MGVMATKEEDNNADLTNQINADLREKLARTQSVEGEEGDVDYSEADYLKEYNKTGRFGWIWLILIALAVASLVFIMLL